MIISISGLPGSGKSTIARMLAEKDQMKHYSIGALRGKMAQDRGMTIDEFNALGMEEDFTDREVDEYQEKLGKSEDDFIADGRTSFYFIPQSFKIFLTVDPRVAAERVFQAQHDKERADEKKRETVEEMGDILNARAENDQKRYMRHYGFDYLDFSKYDLVIDTSSLTPDEIIKQIDQAVTAWSKRAAT